jgi:Domain of unknown function (DUF4450)
MIRIKKNISRLFFVWLIAALQLTAFAQTVTKYSAEGNVITGFNGGNYNNRPLYCNNTDAFILTGDKPLIRFAHTPYLFGAFMAAVERNGKLKWLIDCSSIRMEYRGNMTTWIITDSTVNFPVIHLSVVPMAGTVGMAVYLKAKNAMAGDKLIWVYGGAQYKNDGWLSWNYDIAGNAEMGNWGFKPEDAKDNKVAIANGKFLIGPLIDTLKTKSGPYGVITVNRDTSVVIEVICSEPSKMQVMDASKIYVWQKDNTDVSNPMAAGTIDLTEADENMYWCIKPFSTERNDTLTVYPKQAWQKGLERIEALSKRITVKTPDEKLNTLASVSASVIDGVWYDSVFVHGGMLWNMPFPGWRTIFGGTVYGWHDRVKKQARYYINSQNKSTIKKYPKADTAFLSTLQHKDSRFYGAGHIDKDQLFYNFQTQFFDQLITEWRATGDAELENILYPALQLHLKWEEECFDPDGDGVYESYINTWPTDSQWYNGGGTAEETSYVYKAQQASAEMAMRKNDIVSANYHRKKAELIRKGFFKKLWIAKKGFSGAYREQGGFERLHEDPWLYSIFLPIDTKLVSNDQAVSSLYYTKWALQNDHMPSGGRKVWTSNWVPGIPTVRELYNGDNYHLALAYFLAGMGAEGYDIMKGTFYEGAFNGKVPGDLGVNNGGTDFNDCSSMFARVLVEGLFGYRPDYPNKKVTISPQFPKAWNNASISTPDFSFEFSTKKNVVTTAIHLNKTALIDFYLPLKVTGIKTVLVNGKPVKWELLPGYEKSQLHLQLGETTDASILIETAGKITMNEPVILQKNVGDTVQLKFVGTKIIGLRDAQNVFSKTKITNGVLYGNVSKNSGHHIAVADVLQDSIVEKRIVYLHIIDKVAEEKEKSKSLASIPANAQWTMVNMDKTLNADIRTIFQQQYLSPRPNTVSARIGTDGYSPWTFLFWKYAAPAIKLDSVQYLLKNGNQLLTKQQVPFQWNSTEKNIAFTSLWDNWPKKISVPVNQKGNAVWLIVAGSTNPMQCNIANAVVILNYADKSHDTAALTPPLNYWSLCNYNIKSPSPGVVSRGDYTNETDLFAVPKPWPQTVQLGQNCRAILVSRKLKNNVQLKSITLQTLSQEVVVGLMGITIMK